MNKYERSHVYGSSPFLIFYFIAVIVLYAWFNVYGAGNIGGVTFFAFISIASLPLMLMAKTIYFGYGGKNKFETFIVAFLLTVVISLIFGLTGVFAVYGSEILISAILAAFSEELLIRGVLYPIFTRSTGSMFLSAIASSSVWAVLHTVVYGFSVFMILNFIIIGLILSWAMERSQSLDVPIAIHLLINIAAVIGGGYLV